MRPDATIAAGLCTAASLLVLVGTPRSFAQDALGDGRALDNNLRDGAGGYNLPAQDFRSELEIRNAIVTGNAPGGFSFRGEVGYTAANDFRGALGSNDIFQYQRDSFYSGLATRNLAGLTALQSPLVYSVAGQSAGFFGGPLIIDRSMAHSSVDTATKVPGTAGAIQTDMYGQIAGTMRSPSVQVLRIAEQAETIAVSQGQSEGSRSVMSASPLMGIKSLPETSLVVNPAARYQSAIPLLDPMTLQPRTEETPETATTATTEEEEAPSGSMSLPVSPHQRILSALANGQERVNATREDNLLRPTSATQNPAQPPTTTEPETTEQPGLTPTPPEGEPTIPGLDTEPEEGAEPAAPEQPDQTEQVPGLERLRQMLNPQNTAPSAAASQRRDEGNNVTGTETGAGAKTGVGAVARTVLGGVQIPEVDHLSSKATSQGVFLEHMSRGEKLLADEDWFLAEERFTAALAVMPGNAMAAAGRVHAQIGAGMYLSAAVNLRNLFRAYPEFIPVRFSPELLPRGDRLTRIEAQLRQRMETDRPVARDAALIMAYLGHQYDEPALIEEGFRTLDRVEKAMGVEPDPLEIALRAVWLEGKE